ncbi:RHS repeat-associated core domain-containing protein, partial [Azonexus sp.]|uniref:RHS repeat-associated core domain-containing protein n=1 Tax=Azonexus sp. TaxID=1872668 RepID=UPI002830134A
PFGNSPPEEDPDGDGILFTLNLRFPGQYYDRETNLNYNYFRDYDPLTGRYIQADPIGLAGGSMSLYTYAGNDPLRFIDPDGRFAFLGLLPLLGGGTAAAGSATAGGLGFWGTGALLGGGLVVASMSGDSRQERAEQAQERKEYSRICKSPVPPTGDPCKDAKANLDRLKQCLQLRENFSRKWFNDQDPGHMTEISNTRTAIAKLEAFLKNNCSDSCP